MLLTWSIRYLDRASKKLKDRILFLETNELESGVKEALEFLIETRTWRTERGILNFRHLFSEDDGTSFEKCADRALGFASVYLEEYFEDDDENEITLNEIQRVITGRPNAIVIPSGSKHHDIDYILSKPSPVPVEEITLSQENLRVLGYFCRDFAELRKSAFMEEGPGTIKSSDGPGMILETAVSDDEIRSFVTIFRRLYMANEESNFNEAVDVFVKALGDHRLANWVDGVRKEYEDQLNSVVDRHLLIQAHQCNFTSKRLIDVFLYTQYAHQPDARRERQYNECLDEAGGAKGVFTWMFLTEMWRLSLLIGNAGRQIAWFFNIYCEHHQVVPNVLGSLQDENPGIGAGEKEASRRNRVFREKAEELAMSIWKERGSPVGGPMQFLLIAEEKLRKTLGGDE